MEKKSTVTDLKALLVDRKSEIYFHARENYLYHPSLSAFYRIIRTTNAQYRLRDVDAYIKSGIPKGWIIWGADDVAEYHYQLLVDSGWEVMGYCAFKNNLPTDYRYLTPDETRVLMRNGYSLLAIDQQGQEVGAMGYPEEQILFVKDHLVGRCGHQYFDYFQPGDMEVFLDGGCLDGRTTEDFFRWCRGSYESVYAFEPNPLVQERCRVNLERIQRVKFWNAALWSSSGQMQFHVDPNSMWDAKLSKNGSFSVSCMTIDEATQGNWVSFIKLDVEGAELEVLKGAKKCIERYHPRLAVSIYHNPWDFIEIMTYLHNVVPEYRFALRHYHSDCIETILYASVVK